MESIKSFKDLTSHLSQIEHRSTIVVVNATDEETQWAVFKAIEEGYARAIFVGAEEQVKQHAMYAPVASYCTFLHASTPEMSAALAVQLVREGKGDVLMKGLLNTDILLRAILNKEQGILARGAVLTHIVCTEIPQYPRLLFFTDAAVIPYPTLEQRAAEVSYMVKMCRQFGISEPRISLLHCTEQVNTRIFPFVGDYVTLKERAAAGEWGNCRLDGPLDLRTSVDPEALAHKGITSNVEGQADALIFPDIESGNVFYKTITFFAQAKTAGILQGADAPVVLTSRSDTKETKYLSLALAIISQLDK